MPKPLARKKPAASQTELSTQKKKEVPISNDELKSLWPRIQKLPVGVREQILYFIPLEKLALLCRVSKADFCQQPKFWEDKLKYDGYFLIPDYDMWVRSQLCDYHSLAHFYQLFSDEKFLDGKQYQDDKKKIEKFTAYCYEVKDALQRQRPQKFSKGKWQDINDKLIQETRDSWHRWWQLSNIFLDLFFQRKIAKLRKKDRSLVITVPLIRSSEIPADYETLLFLFRRKIDKDGYENYIMDDIRDSLLIKPFVEIPKSHWGLPLNWDSVEVVFNRMLRLNDLLMTGDLLYFHETYYFVLKQKSDTLKLIEIIEQNSEYFFPPEALSFLVENNVFYGVNPGRYYSATDLEDQMPGTIIKGFTYLDKDSKLIFYYFAGKTRQKSKKLPTGETITYSNSIYTNKTPNEQSSYKKKLKNHEFVIPELDESKWLELAEREENTDDESFEEEDD